MVFYWIGLCVIDSNTTHIDTQYNDIDKEKRIDNTQEKQQHLTDITNKKDSGPDLTQKVTNYQGYLPPIMPSASIVHYPTSQLNLNYLPSLPSDNNAVLHYPRHQNTNQQEHQSNQQQNQQQNQHHQTSLISVHPDLSSMSTMALWPIRSKTINVMAAPNNEQSHHVMSVVPMYSDMSSLVNPSRKQMTTSFYKIPMYFPMTAVMPMLMSLYAATAANNPSNLSSSRPAINVPIPLYMNTVRTDPWRSIEITPKDGYHYDIPIRKFLF